MRFLVLPLLFNAFMLQGQSGQTAIQTGFYNKLIQAVAVPDGDLLLLSNNYISEDFSRLNITKVAGGQAKEFGMFHFIGAYTQYDLLALPDRYLLLRSGFECDINAVELFAIDTTAKVLWSTYLRDYGFVYYEPIKLMPGVGDFIWVMQPNLAPRRFSSIAGAYVDSASASIPASKGVLEISGNRLLTYGDAGLMVYSAADLKLLNSKSLNATIDDAQLLPNGNLTVVTPERIFLLGKNLSILAEIELFPTTANRQLAVADTSIWLLLSDDKLVQFDQQLKYSTFHALSPTDGRVKQIKSVQNQLLLIREEDATPAFSTQVLHIQPFPAPVKKKDAGLEKLSVGKAVATWFGNGPVFEIRFQDVKVTVANNSDSILHEITINTQASGGAIYDICPYLSTFQQTFTNLAIPPNGLQELVLPDFKILGKYSTPTTYTLCYWTTRPDGTLDPDHSNNSACTTLSVTVGINDPAAVQPVNLFPNPASDVCTIEWPDGLLPAAIRLYDSHGRLCFQQETVSSLQIERKNLPAGLYRCLITAEDGKMYAASLVWR